jgi:hypothetical protein
LFEPNATTAWVPRSHTAAIYHEGAAIPWAFAPSARMGREASLAYVVAIPALNEEEHIGACLEALDGQVGARLDHIVLFANNCSDDTVAVARSVRFASGARLHVVEASLAPEEANAGAARRRAMDAALPLAGLGGLLLTTDADGLVDPDWLAATQKAMDSYGADVVAGWAELHPLDWERIPVQLHEDDARECEFDALCDEIHGLLDPDPCDPLPRHTQHSGASIAVTVDAYLRCGGVPTVACGEDRALVAALRRVDAGVRHDPAVRVVVSGRMDGRAAGGMAETIRRRMLKPDEMLDYRLEPAADCTHRAYCRGPLRHAFNAPTAELSALGDVLAIPIGALRPFLNSEFFGQAWEPVEAASPRLKRTRVSVANMAEEVAAAEEILKKLRAADYAGLKV